MERSDTDCEYESGAPGPPTKKKLLTEIVHKKCVTTDSRQDFKPSETQSTDNESRRGLPLQVIADIVIEHDNNQMEVDDGNLTTDHVQKPRQIIGIRLNKAPKTSAERGREFRARKALLKQQCKQQQEPDAIVEITAEDIRSAGPSEKNQVPEPSEITIIEKRAKSAEATRRWREKKRALSESSKKQAKTAAQRMREYRERKKLAKKRLLEQQSDQNSVSTSSSQVNQRAGPSRINSISVEITRRGNLQSQQQIEKSERTQEYRERRNDNVNIKSNNPSGNNEEQSDLCDLTLTYDDITKHKKAHENFDRKFKKNPFGYSRTVCDRLWFKNDLKKASDNYEDLLKKITENTNACKRRNSESIDQEEQLQSSASNTLPDESAVAFGRSVGCQLQKLSKKQRYITEKLISDIIFHAKMEQLTPDTSIKLEENTNEIVIPQAAPSWYDDAVQDSGQRENSTYIVSDNVKIEIDDEDETESAVNFIKIEPEESYLDDISHSS